MATKQLRKLLQSELKRIEKLGTTKRKEIQITDFFMPKEGSVRAIIGKKKYLLFNSNDYLGLRHDKKLIQAEHNATVKYGVGPGAVRFISGTLKPHIELERALATFHKRQSAIVFSSAFAANLATLHCFLKAQSKDSLASANVLILSDELNHRSIIDGIRIANLDKSQKQVFAHLDMIHLEQLLIQNRGKFDRVLIVSDGVFSMLGEVVNVRSLQQVAKKYGHFYKQGIITIIDDSHGVAAFGATGRGSEEFTKGKADLLVGTLGKGFGVDGGYVVGDKLFIDYLRESAATYIYSNPIPPGCAAAALTSIKSVNSSRGKSLLRKLEENIFFFKDLAKKLQVELAANSPHPIQPVLIGDSLQTKKLVGKLFKKGFMCTNISYPVVAKGRDEIRIQLNATHTKLEIESLLEEISNHLKK